MIDGCDILDVSQNASIFCNRLSETGGAAIESMNYGPWFTANLITGANENPEATLFIGMVMMCTTWPVAFAHVCIPIGAGIMYTWFTEVFHLWGWV